MRLLDVETVLSWGGLRTGANGTIISFFTTLPDRFIVVTVLCVVALAKTAESGPIALVRRLLFGGKLIVERGKEREFVP